jgi:predicted metal-dependent enzyme (double-stranded beta helix superfamily)
MTTVKYALDEFVHDMSALVDEQPEQDRLFDLGSSYLERLINNPEAIQDEFRVPAGYRGRDPNHGTYLLHHGDNGLLVTTVVWGPGDHIGPHDHCTWGMIGVMDNGITETRFARHDDRSRDDYAELERDRETLVRPGEVSLLIPDVDEIHQMDNYSDTPTVEIHVYGHDLRGLRRSRYNVETGEVRHFATTRFDNC